MAVQELFPKDRINWSVDLALLTRKASCRDFCTRKRKVFWALRVLARCRERLGLASAHVPGAVFLQEATLLSIESALPVVAAVPSGATFIGTAGSTQLCLPSRCQEDAFPPGPTLTSKSKRHSGSAKTPNWSTQDSKVISEVC